MPDKANEARRHKIPRARYKVANWAECPDVQRCCVLCRQRIAVRWRMLGNRSPALPQAADVQLFRHFSGLPAGLALAGYLAPDKRSLPGRTPARPRSKTKPTSRSNEPE